jgi:hypothetical protein
MAEENDRVPTKEEIEAEANKWSFDLQPFLDYMNPSSDWERIIRAHVYADFVLYTSLEEAFEQKDVFDADRLTFPQKLRLVCALGVIPRDAIGPFGALNRVRNGLVHRVDAPLSEKDKMDLRNSLPPRLHDAALSLANYDRDSPLSEPDFKNILITMVIDIEVARRRAKLARLDLQRTLKKVRAFLTPESRQKGRAEGGLDSDPAD